MLHIRVLTLNFFLHFVSISTLKAEIKIFDGVIYKENDGVITYVDTRQNNAGKPLLLMTPGALFAHHGASHGSGGHGHALKEPFHNIYIICMS